MQLTAVESLKVIFPRIKKQRSEIHPKEQKERDISRPQKTKKKRWEFLRALFCLFLVLLHAQMCGECFWWAWERSRSGELRHDPDGSSGCLFESYWRTLSHRRIPPKIPSSFDSSDKGYKYGKKNHRTHKWVESRELTFSPSAFFFSAAALLCSDKLSIYSAEWRNPHFDIAFTLFVLHTVSRSKITKKQNLSLSHALRAHSIPLVWLTRPLSCVFFVCYMSFFLAELNEWLDINFHSLFLKFLCCSSGPLFRARGDIFSLFCSCIISLLPYRVCIIVKRCFLRSAKTSSLNRSRRDQVFTRCSAIACFLHRTARCARL